MKYLALFVVVLYAATAAAEPVRLREHLASALMHSPVPMAVAIVSGKGEYFITVEVRDFAFIDSGELHQWMSDQTGYALGEVRGVPYLVHSAVRELYGQPVPPLVSKASLQSMRDHVRRYVDHLNDAEDGNIYMVGSYPVRPIRPDLSLHRWDPAIASVADFCAWVLAERPNWRLVARYTPVDAYPHFTFFQQGDDGKALRDEHGKPVPEQPRGVPEDFRERFDYVVTFEFELPRLDLRQERVREHVIAQMNADAFPDASADEILLSLSGSDSLSAFQRLVRTLAAARMSPTYYHEGGRVPDGASDRQREILHCAAWLGHMMSPAFYLDMPGSTLSEPRTPAERLIAARLAAWRGDIDTVRQVRTILEKDDPLTSDEDAHLATTLDILNLRLAEVEGGGE